MAMKGGVGAGGSGGDEPWARAGDESGHGNGNGKAAVRELSWRERENNRLRERRRRVISSWIFTSLRAHGNNRCREEPNPPAGDGDQQMADVADIGGSAPVNPGGGSNGLSLTRASSPSGITLGGSGVSSGGGADPIPAWLTNLSKQLSDNSYPNFFASSSNGNAPATAQDGSPPSSPPRLRKRARYSSPPPATPPSSPARDSNSNVPPLMSMNPFTSRVPGPDPAVTLLAEYQISTARASFVASDAMSLSAGSSALAWMLPPVAPGRSVSGASSAAVGVRGRGAALMNSLGFSFGRSGGGEQVAAWEDEEEVMMTETEKNADEEEGLQLSLGSAETRKDSA